MRIVSLLPSAREIVYALGYGRSLVGVSHECDFPAEAKTKPKMIEPVYDTTRMGSEEIDAVVVESMKQGRSIYRIRFDELQRANSDLIITQELCDVCAIGAADVLEAVNKLGKPVSVLSLNPHTLRDVQADIASVAKALDCTREAERVVAGLEAKASRIRNLTKDVRRVRVFCAEWLRPVMNAGHWVPELLEYAGGLAELAEKGTPSTYVDWPSVLSYNPDIVILMPCGFTTTRTVEEAGRFLHQPQARDLTAVRNGRVYATDGHNYFSRSGPRLWDGIEILARMIHPELFRDALDPGLGRVLRVEGEAYGRGLIGGLSKGSGSRSMGRHEGGISNELISYRTRLGGVG